MCHPAKIYGKLRKQQGMWFALKHKDLSHTEIALPYCFETLPPPSISEVSRYIVKMQVLAILAWASASASASVTILLDRDVHLCSAFPHLPCGQYKLFVILAFMTWSFRAASAASLFCLFASLLGWCHANVDCSTSRLRCGSDVFL